MSITINEPCKENWENMSPTEKGAFCQQCAMEVHDFSKQTPDEIRTILKQKLGSRVCGRFTADQLDTLNHDFNQWKKQLGSKRSFQSALIFSLIVVFGMTLFSCEEEDVTIGTIQKVGQVMIGAGDIGNGHVQPQKESIIEHLKSEQAKLEPIEIPEIYDELVVGEIAYDPDVIIEEPPVPLSKEQVVIEERMVHVLGGPGLSREYVEYIEAYEPLGTEGEKEFSSLVYPNPVIDRATLKVEVPEATSAQMKLFNLSGQMIRDLGMHNLEEGTFELPVEVYNLQRGMYIITIASKEYQESVKFQKH